MYNYFFTELEMIKYFQHPPQMPPLLLNILAFFSDIHPKQSQHDVLLRE